MSTVYRLPRVATNLLGPAEDGQLAIELQASATFFLGGTATGYLAPWKNSAIVDGSFCPYLDAVIDFTAPAAVVIGNGSTDRIGLYGVAANGTPGSRALLAILGVNLGGAAPQIPIVAALDGKFVGFSQVVCNVGMYTYLGIGAVSAQFVASQVITVKARPIIRRDYAG